MSERVMVLEVEVPAIYTADLDGLREYQAEGESESEFLLNCIGRPSTVRLRAEISGEKDSSIEEVWGHVRGAHLAPPTPNITEEQLEEWGWKLVPEEGAS